MTEEFAPMASHAPRRLHSASASARFADPGPPPAWYTGVVEGWRVWRDEGGMLHAVNDAQGSAPGMYG
jgi:hypothetical protein